MTLSAKKVPAPAPPQNDARIEPKNEELKDSKTDADDFFMPATPTQQGASPEPKDGDLPHLTTCIVLPSDA